ncbi:MAG: 3-keto-5-aminohexanoate cleavage protein [Gammaproteobacteria bacterium]|uniref:3-keto-5-aminohexanoate cleavage protein n=1 Tax=Vreelandella venusta TaxID=44935 RepID=UPI0022857346|nr:3-keto-5-aminohexanoate cleavage protein [Halomonas venusta]MBR9924143.1 3-keto-5-aminohexanoate cleavage protein [Gammaproteobacteria bacterium]MDX1713645.1 3-keto-5-aminohexanoate cleavage protein [Halomonas venusta]WAM47370.1 3-keto-5-aminohexanoate cleavage protein [Halomonas venusta]WAM50865.1 3-keto-5-aminohexanoate cleavage protein [Halomonas venusta]
MNRNVILTCAVTGAGDTTGKNPHVPITPKQIANDCITAAKAGASVAHIHVRDPETGGISHSLDHFREVMERVREANVDIVMNITAGGGGDWIPDAQDPTRGGPGTDIQTPAQRHEPVGELLPELCTLDCGSLNFGDMVYVNPADWLREHARLVQAAGVKPELECFDLGHVWFARQLQQEGLIDGDPLYQLCLGIPWGAEADTESMLAMRNKLPENAHWAAFGIGRHQMPMVAQAVLLGGHARVGLEDNLFLKKGILATNGQLVEHAATLIDNLGGRVMTPAETRAHLNLRDPHSKHSSAPATGGQA